MGDCKFLVQKSNPVSLFTREWIEITSVKFLSSCNKSPSLRGSGLKFFINKSASEQSGLPLYEGVD